MSTLSAKILDDEMPRSACRWNEDNRIGPIGHIGPISSVGDVGIGVRHNAATLNSQSVAVRFAVEGGSVV